MLIALKRINLVLEKNNLCFPLREHPHKTHTHNTAYWCVVFAHLGGGRNAISVGVGAIASSYNIFAYSNVRSAFGLTKCRHSRTSTCLNSNSTDTTPSAYVDALTTSFLHKRYAPQRTYYTPSPTTTPCCYSFLYS